MLKLYIAVTSLSYNCSIRWDALDHVCQQASQSSHHPLYENPVVIAVRRKHRGSFVSCLKQHFLNSVRVSVCLSATTALSGPWSISLSSLSLSLNCHFSSLLPLTASNFMVRYFVSLHVMHYLWNFSQYHFYSVVVKKTQDKKSLITHTHPYSHTYVE